MSGGYAADKQHGSDRVCADRLPACPTCGDLCPPDATRCECGERLMPKPYELPPPPVAGPFGCTCGGNGICTVCVLAEYEGAAS